MGFFQCLMSPMSCVLECLLSWSVFVSSPSLSWYVLDPPRVGDMDPLDPPRLIHLSIERHIARHHRLALLVGEPSQPHCSLRDGLADGR